jgi:hypothetical protein
LFSSGCKKADKFDITGSWIFSRSFDNLEIFIDDMEIVFTGDEFYGTVTLPANLNTGTYTVGVSNDIDFTLDNGSAIYTGAISGSNNMGGTFEWKGDTGAWSAARQP